METTALTTEERRAVEEDERGEPNGRQKTSEQRLTFDKQVKWYTHATKVITHTILLYYQLLTGLQTCLQRKVGNCFRLYKSCHDWSEPSGFHLKKEFVKEGCCDYLKIL